MATYERPIVVGVFEDREHAERAVDELRGAGFAEDDVGFAVRDETKREDVEVEDEGGSRAGEGAVTGMVTGGLIGGLLAAGAALLIPGVGPIIGGGILATILGGAAAGAAAGGLLGALTGLGVPEEEARYYESEFQAGRTIVTVKAGERYQEAAEILSRHHGYDMERGQERARAYATDATSAAIADTSTAATGTLAASPGAAQTGGAAPVYRDSGMTPAASTGSGGGTEHRALAGDHTATGEGTAPVAHGAAGPPLQRHEQSADMIHGEAGERGTAGTETGGAGAGTSGQTSDQDQVQRQSQSGTSSAGEGQIPQGTTVVRPEGPESSAGQAGGGVSASGTSGATGTGSQGLSATTSRASEGQATGGEAAQVPIVQETGERATGHAAHGAGSPGEPYVDRGEGQQPGDRTTGSMPGTTMGSWDEASAGYRQRWQQRSQQSGAAGGRWEDAEPGYRYGHEMASHERFHGRQWQDAESDLRGGFDDWTQRQGHRTEGGWDHIKDGVRDAWDRVRGHDTDATAYATQQPSDEPLPRAPGRAPGERGDPA